LDLRSVTTPLLLSLGVVTCTLLVLLPIGILLGYLQARVRYRGKGLVDALILLPLILPPSVVGYALLLLFGRVGPIGAVLESLFGVRLVFSFWGAVLAATVVAFPMMAKGAEAAFSRVDVEIEEAAALDGLSRWGILWRITIPLSLRGLLAAVVLTMGRALGEFGATLLFAGNIQGQTNTLPLEMYQALLLNEDKRAMLLAAILTLVSIAIAGTLSYLRGKAE
jgi:molybdate transport system permease protein